MTEKCTFCDKGKEEVYLLIAGPDDVYICDECIDLCVDMLEDKRRRDRGEYLDPSEPTNKKERRIT